MRAPIGIAVVAVLGGAGACRRDGERELEIMAPLFDMSRARFTSYVYAPVGAFADKRGSLLPYIDANGNGVFDSDTEASGRCDRRAGQCRIDARRLRLIMAVDDCSLQTGTWLIGDAFDHTGERLDAQLCDAEGSCSEDHAGAFQDAAPARAIWLPGLPEAPRHETLALRLGEAETRYPDVELPAPIHLTKLDVTRAGDLAVTTAADQSIDMAVLTVMRGAAVEWSSSAEPTRLRARGHVLEAAVPRAVLDRCGGACEGFVQVAHVWRDDDVFSMADIKHRVF